MTDEEARGIVLRKIYDISPSGEFVNGFNLPDLSFDHDALSRFLTDLDNLKLITMKP